MSLYKKIAFVVVTLIVLYLWGCEAKADNYDSYLKIGLGYNFSAQDSIEYKPTGFKQSLYNGDKFSYSVESGISVSTETGNALHLGVYWYDLLNESKANAKVHRPYKFEVFSDYVYQWDDFMFVKIGAGYKIFEQTQVNCDYYGQPYTMSSGTNILDKITARLAIGRQFGNYSLSLEHHSQWFKGKPFDHDWEYHVTNVSLAYTF